MSKCNHVCAVLHYSLIEGLCRVTSYIDSSSKISGAYNIKPKFFFRLGRITTSTNYAKGITIVDML